MSDLPAWCPECHWSGLPGQRCHDASLAHCLRSKREAAACTPARAPASAPVAPPASILDAAIAASSALDPLGSRKPDESLRVPTWDEREAERKRVAERIASMGRAS